MAKRDKQTHQLHICQCFECKQRIEKRKKQVAKYYQDNKTQLKEKGKKNYSTQYVIGRYY